MNKRKNDSPEEKVAAIRRHLVEGHIRNHKGRTVMERHPHSRVVLRDWIGGG